MNDPTPPATRRIAATTDFTHRLRVYWEDTDAGGIVFYGNHLKFFERARTEWLRSLGFSQQRLRLDQGLMFVVAETSLRYRQPAYLDDVLDITVNRLDAGRVSMWLAQQAWRDDTLLAEGEIRIGCVRAADAGGTFKPCRLPDALIAKMATPE